MIYKNTRTYVEALSKPSDSGDLLSPNSICELGVGAVAVDDRVLAREDLCDCLALDCAVVFMRIRTNRVCSAACTSWRDLAIDIVASNRHCRPTGHADQGPVRTHSLQSFLALSTSEVPSMRE